MSTFLACGPHFAEGAELTSLALFLLVKPLAYFGFVQAFRYWVSRAIPMSMAQAAGLAGVRAILGVVLVGGGALLLVAVGKRDEFLLISWVYMYLSRIAAWWWVGRRLARLTGRRLTGWVIAGTLLNAAFDVAVVLGLTAGWQYVLGMVTIIAIFIAVLHYFGSRERVKMRFYDHPVCRVCTYNLTGNLSGICPECGTPISLAPAIATSS